jgi:hypothetical protein
MMELDILRVSEYASEDSNELFAELTAAKVFGTKVPNVLMEAYDEYIISYMGK